MATELDLFFMFSFGTGGSHMLDTGLFPDKYQPRTLLFSDTLYYFLALVFFPKAIILPFGSENRGSNSFGFADRALAGSGKTCPFLEDKSTVQTSRGLGNEIIFVSQGFLHMGQMFVHLFFRYVENARNVTRSKLTGFQELCYSFSDSQDILPDNSENFGPVFNRWGIGSHGIRLPAYYSTREDHAFSDEYRAGSASCLTMGRCFEQDVMFGFKARMACTFSGDCHGPKISQ